ncbi:hypothetical protein B0H12DRAFT_1119589 [Mycena haematopus]|nr:hypothetical protein B0H12DRAFT_1119589 [Mycena haematopus]
MQHLATAVYTRATESYCRGTPLPAGPPKPAPPRDPPAPVYIDIHHHTVRKLVNDLLTIASFKSKYINPRYIPPCTETAFALTALAVLNDHTHPLHSVFWSLDRRIDTANRVQRVIEPGQNLIIPAPWTSAAHALNALASREDAGRAAVAKRTLALEHASRRRAGVSPQTTKTQTPRVTRAAAARQTQQQQQMNASSSTDVDATPASRERQGKPPVEASTPTPQRTSARQQKKQRVAQETVENIPPAVVASTTACVPRARSASQESNETLVASTSSVSPISSRAVSVASADTVVGIDVISSSSKGKGRLIASVSASTPEDAVVPMDTEAGMVTRSRTTKTPPETNPARATPYPTTKDAQLSAGRGQNQSKRAPTGKRKVAKSKAK